MDARAGHSTIDKEISGWILSATPVLAGLQISLPANLVAVRDIRRICVWLTVSQRLCNGQGAQDGGTIAVSSMLLVKSDQSQPKRGRRALAARPSPTITPSQQARHASQGQCCPSYWQTLDQFSVVVRQTMTITECRTLHAMLINVQAVRVGHVATWAHSLTYSTAKLLRGACTWQKHANCPRSIWRTPKNEGGPPCRCDLQLYHGKYRTRRTRSPVMF